MRRQLSNGRNTTEMAAHMQHGDARDGDYRRRPDDEEWLSSREAAAYTRQSCSTLAKRRVRGDGPPYTIVTGRVLYPKSGLDQWLLSKLRRSTSQLDPDA